MGWDEMMGRDPHQGGDGRAGSGLGGQGRIWVLSLSSGVTSAMLLSPSGTISLC